MVVVGAKESKVAEVHSDTQVLAKRAAPVVGKVAVGAKVLAVVDKI